MCNYMSGQRVCTIIIIRKALLITTAVTTLLLGYYECGFDSVEWRRQQKPARRDAAIQSATFEHTCRALFTITSVHPNHSLSGVYTSRTSVSNETYSDGWSSEKWRVGDSAVTYLSDGKSSVAASKVRHLLRKRDSPSGASTSDYYSLAAHLPKLLSFGEDESGEKINHRKYVNYKDINQGQWKQNDSKPKSPFFLGKSRVSAGDGVLPYVPCTVAPYDHPATFTACVKRRLEETPRLWLCFMGDSKVRHVFTELVNSTDSEFQYNINLMNTNQSWPEVRKILRTYVWSDMEASTTVAPRLRITYRFRRFNQMRQILFNSTQELVELQRWASGADPTPDLLVVGYTSWMTQWKEVFNEEENHYPPDILDFLLQMHKVVVPLLEQIAHRTRVLVLPQSRLRPHSYSTPNILAAFSTANYDWSEMTFRHLLQRYRARQASREAPRHLAWDNHVRNKQRTKGALERVTTPSENPESTGAKEQTMAHQDDPRPLGATVRGTTQRNYLVPTSSTSGLWWWDSSLPLNLAGILECDELYRRGLTSHSAFRSRMLFCLDSQHAGAITNTDLVTMLLNLLCNSYLGLHHSTCCS